jgi:hypothetical protein
VRIDGLEPLTVSISLAEAGKMEIGFGNKPVMNGENNFNHSTRDSP